MNGLLDVLRDKDCNCFILSLTGNTPLHLAVMLGRKGTYLFFVYVFLMFKSYIGYQKCVILLITDNQLIDTHNH